MFIFETHSLIKDLYGVVQGSGGSVVEAQPGKECVLESPDDSGPNLMCRLKSRIQGQVRQSYTETVKISVIRFSEVSGHVDTLHEHLKHVFERC